jgi:hypothetical protein
MTAWVQLYRRGDSARWAETLYNNFYEGYAERKIEE